MSFSESNYKIDDSWFKSSSQRKTVSVHRDCDTRDDVCYQGLSAPPPPGDVPLSRPVQAHRGPVLLHRGGGGQYSPGGSSGSANPGQRHQHGQAENNEE